MVPLPDTGAPDATEPATEVIVSIAEDHLPVLAGVVERLRGAGMAVRDVLEPIGAVTGSVADDAVAALETVPGVLAVERQRGFQLPPEGSPQ